MDTELLFQLAQIAVLAVVLGIALVTASVVERFVPTHPEPGGRSASVDGLRGLAAVSVVACHINQYVLTYAGLTEPTLLGDHVGILAVQLFFAITAFLFTGRVLAGRMEVVSFIVGRVLRIVPLYLFVTVVAVLIVLWVTRHEARFPPDLSALLQVFRFGFWGSEQLTLSGFNMLRLVGIAWTLSYEWAFYLLLVPTALLIRRWPVGLYFVLCLALAWAAWDFSRQPEQVIWPFFLAGVAAALLRQTGVELTPGRAWLSAVLSGLAFVGVLVLPGFWTPLKLVLATMVFLGAVFGDWRVLRARPLQVLGTISYSVYLLQYLVLFATTEVAVRLPVVALRIGVLFAIPAIVIGLALLTYRWVERPFMDLSRGIPRRNRTHAVAVRP